MFNFDNYKNFCSCCNLSPSSLKSLDLFYRACYCGYLLTLVEG